MKMNMMPLSENQSGTSSPTRTEARTINKGPTGRNSYRSSLNNRAVLSGTATEITVTRRSASGDALHFRIGPHNVILDAVSERDLASLNHFIQTGKPAASSLDKWGRNIRRLSYFANFLHQSGLSLAGFSSVDDVRLQLLIVAYAAQGGARSAIINKEIARSLDDWFVWNNRIASGRLVPQAFVGPYAPSRVVTVPVANSAHHGRAAEQESVSVFGPRAPDDAFSLPWGHHGDPQRGTDPTRKSTEHADGPLDGIGAQQVGHDKQKAL